MAISDEWISHIKKMEQAFQAFERFYNQSKVFVSCWVQISDVEHLTWQKKEDDSLFFLAYGSESMSERPIQEMDIEKQLFCYTRLSLLQDALEIKMEELLNKYKP